MRRLVHLFPTGAGPDLQQGIALLLEAKDAYAANPNVKCLQCLQSMQPNFPSSSVSESDNAAVSYLNRLQAAKTARPC